MASATAIYRDIESLSKAEGRTARVTYRLVASIVTANALWIVWTNRFLPLSDYPDYIYEGSILSQKMRGVQLPDYAIKRYAFTHAAVPILCALLNFITTPEVAAKIVLSLAIATFVVGSTYLLRACGRTEGSPLFYVPLLYVLNSWFWFGEIDFIIGFVGFLFFTGYVLRRREHLETLNQWVIGGALSAIFVAHLMAYLACLAVVAGVLVEKRKQPEARRILWPALTSLILLAWYVAGRITTHQLGPHQLYERWPFWVLVSNFIEAFSVFHIFLPWSDPHSDGMHLAGAINLLTALGLAVIVLAPIATWLLRREWPDALVCAIALCLFGYVAGGRSILGANGAERLTFPAAWLAMTWVAPRLRLEPRALEFAVIGLLAIQACVFNVQIRAVSADLAILDARFAQASSRSELCAIYNDFFDRSWGPPHRPLLERFVPNHQNTIRLPFYLYMERDESTAPILDVGIFNYSGAGNPNQLCK